MKAITPTLLDQNRLPDQVDELKKLVVDLIAAMKSKDDSIERLRHQLYLAAKYRYGRKSEQLNDDQLSIFIQEIEGQLGQMARANHVQKPSEEIETVTYTRKKGHGRGKPQENLPRVRVEHPLPDDQKTCPDCRKPLAKMGEDVRNTLEHIPAMTYIREDVLEKWACPCCKSTPVTSEAPSRPIERCVAGPGFLAQVVTAKYADHLPLYRQAEIFERGGLEIRRSTLCDWVGSTAELLEPLYEAIKQDVLKSKVIGTDDTTVPYLDGSLAPDRLGQVDQEAEADKPDHCRRAKTGRLWTYVGDKDHAHIVYDFTENRSAEGPKAFLGNWKGYLQADAYAGYDWMFIIQKAVEVACWAHGRRKFNEAKESDRDQAKMALAYIRKLYEVEWEADEKELVAIERQALRQVKSKPILISFKVWMDAQALVTLPKSPFGAALTYVFNQWEALNRYLEDGDLSIDNNVSERAMRCVAIGRKNWLFAGSVAGGKWAAILYSLVASCKRHKIDPYLYLRDVIGRVKTHPMSRISELLPATYVPGPPPETPKFLQN